MLWILRTGAPWEDLPARYGAVGTVSSRFYRWRKAGVFDRVLQRLQAQADARGDLDWDLRAPFKIDLFKRRGDKGDPLSHIL